MSKRDIQNHTHVYTSDHKSKVTDAVLAPDKPIKKGFIARLFRSKNKAFSDKNDTIPVKEEIVRPEPKPEPKPKVMEKLSDLCEGSLPAREMSEEEKCKLTELGATFLRA